MWRICGRRRWELRFLRMGSVNSARAEGSTTRCWSRRDGFANKEIDVESWTGPQHSLSDSEQCERGRGLRKLRRPLLRMAKTGYRMNRDLTQSDGKKSYEPPRLTAISLRPEEAVLGKLQDLRHDRSR
jgi:hypothetical protein